MRSIRFGLSRSVRRGASGQASENPQGGFSLLELIVVVSILAIILLAIVLVLDPLQILARAWDSQRQTDIGSLADAIEWFKANDAPITELGGFDPDGNYDGDGDLNTDEGCAGEGNQTVFVSVVGTDASGTCASPPDDLPTGWTYRCAPNDGPQDVDGTGWLPIDLTNGGVATPAISHLPSDPANSWSSGHYYTYVCARGGGYEFTARMTSEKFWTGGPGDVQSDDGGDDIFVYETGTDLKLDPKAPMSAWHFGSKTSGTIPNNETEGLEDSNGSNHGSADNNGGMNWAAGILGGAVEIHDDTADDVEVTDDPSLESPTRSTVVAWYFLNDWNAGSSANIVIKGGDDDSFWFRIEQPENYVECRYQNSMSSVAAGNPMVAVSLTEWRQAACVYNQATTSLTTYDNAVATEVQDTGGLPYPDTVFDWEFGHLTSSSIDGRIDEVMWYDRPLSAVEIAYQYEALKP